MQENYQIIQIAHGRLIPGYSSAYALRCIRYLSHFKNRKILSTGGLIFHDEEDGCVKQYRSILMTGLAFLKGGRTLEIYLSKGRFLRRKYLKELISEVKKSKVVIFEGPWQFYLLKDLLSGKLVVYDAHNVESVLRRGDYWEKYTRELEKELVNRADHVITVSEEDSGLIQSVYGKDKQNVSCIPEGFELPAHTWNGANSKDLVFIGSAYLPNIQAAKNISDIARKLSQFTFKIIGSVCSSLRKKDFPENVKLMGILDEASKENELCNSFLALNPVAIGSGRNVKMIDYISHGIPVITTDVGSRGFKKDFKELFSVHEIDYFADSIIEADKNRESLKDKSNRMLILSKEFSYEETRRAASDLILSLLGNS